MNDPQSVMSDQFDRTYITETENYSLSAIDHDDFSYIIENKDLNVIEIRGAQLGWMLSMLVKLETDLTEGKKIFKEYIKSKEKSKDGGVVVPIKH